ncbi:MAG TPA: hypothetical protein DCM71_15555 [Runella sp.]|nr:hypothetical protein [Runella sp.]
MVWVVFLHVFANAWLSAWDSHIYSQTSDKRLTSTGTRFAKKYPSLRNIFFGGGGGSGRGGRVFRGWGETGSMSSNCRLVAAW